MESQKSMAERFSNNIEIERTKLGMSQAQMAKALNMSLSTYKNIINGDSIRIDCFSAYLVFKVTGKFFYELCGDVFPEFEIMRMCRELTPSQQKFIKKIVEIEAALKVGQNSADDFVPLIIPTGDVSDGMIWDSCQIDQLNVSEYRKRHQNIDCAVLISSDHLSPAYLKGDILLINQSAPRDGDQGIFIDRESGRVYIRKLIRDSIGATIVPINGTGKSFVVGLDDMLTYDKWIKFGIVITKLRQEESQWLRLQS